MQAKNIKINKIKNNFTNLHYIFEKKIIFLN